MNPEEYYTLDQARKRLKLELLNDITKIIDRQLSADNEKEKVDIDRFLSELQRTHSGKDYTPQWYALRRLATALDSKWLS